ncbi:hypothetical protein [Hymenobacter seoulensis]
MRIYLLGTSLLLSGILSVQTSAAQSVEAVREFDGPIQVDPDSLTRNLFRQAKVRSVHTVRLTEEGEVRDTVTYQEIDRFGRYTRVDRKLSPELHRQWSYDAQGRCTSLITYPTSSWRHTVIYTYNPDLHRGIQEVIKANGTRTTISEVKLEQRADTLLTEFISHGIPLGNSTILNRESRDLTMRYTPHPDTVLVLKYNYNGLGKLEWSGALYNFSRRGRLLEVGSLDLRDVAKVQKVKYEAGNVAPLLSYAQVLSALRHKQGFYSYPRQRWTYDSNNRVATQQTWTRINRTGQFATTIVKYTYNSANQIISHEQSTSSVYSPAKKTYSVFSYLPNGLLLRETSDARSEKPAFYRYEYQYYE